MEIPPPQPGIRGRIHEVIYESDTRAGRAFDITLFFLIIISVLAAVFETMAPVRAQYGEKLRALEWIITILFTIEYVLRLISVKRPLGYATSFFGVIDLLSILPSFVSILFPGSQSLIVIRGLRLIRIFRVFKLARFVADAEVLRTALLNSGRKIIVFLSAVLTLVVVIGTIMYLVEGGSHGFESIPQSVYWAIVTMTTVGYGDVVPTTILGRFIASAVMILGYGIIAVPTGIVTVELVSSFRGEVSGQACPDCSAEGHRADAKFCRRCGSEL